MWGYFEILWSLLFLPYIYVLGRITLRSIVILTAKNLKYKETREKEDLLDYVVSLIKVLAMIAFVLFIYALPPIILRFLSENSGYEAEEFVMAFHVVSRALALLAGLSIFVLPEFPAVVERLFGRDKK